MEIYDINVENDIFGPPGTAQRGAGVYLDTLLPLPERQEHTSTWLSAPLGKRYSLHNTAPQVPGSTCQRGM